MLAAVLKVPVGIALRVGDAIGSATFYLLRKRRRIAIDNLLKSDLGVDEIEARRIAHQSFQSFTRMLVETLFGKAMINASNWREFVDMECSEEARKLMSDPKSGALLAACHLGNWEVALRAAAMLKPINVVYRPFDNPYIDKEMNGGRGSEQLHFIPKADFKATGAIRSLRKGDLFGLMIDQHIGGSHQRERVQFFGRGAWAPRSVALMVLASKVPVLVACAARTGKMRFTAHIAGPIEFRPTGDRERDTHELTQLFTTEIEKMARRFPEQYMWGHRRWRD